MGSRTGKFAQAGIWLIVALLLVAAAFLASTAAALGEGEASSTATASASSTVSSTAAEASQGSAARSSSSTAAESKRSVVDEALAGSAVPNNTIYTRADTDSAGTLFTFQTPLEATHIAGDLYWAGDTLELVKSRVGNDVMAMARETDLVESDIGGDLRVAGQRVHLSKAIVQGNVDALAFDVAIDASSAAAGYYCGGGHISYEGTSKRFIAYGQTIYFDGVVEGDVTLSAQEIVIGEHAKVTGTLDIRSGQSIETLVIPPTAQIARLDTTLNQPNTIDQITQLRAYIAPYFQVGSMLFVVVSFILLGLALLWGFGHKMTEANRLVRRYPLAVLVLGAISIMLLFVVLMLGPLLIFTIPFSLVALLVLLMSLICCIPFTGASLALMLRERLHPALCTVIGAAAGGVLLFIPYLNMVLVGASMLYFVGYLVNISMFGHDEYHDASFHHREADSDASSGRSHGILPVNADIDAFKMAEIPEPSDEQAEKANDESGDAAEGESGANEQAGEAGGQAGTTDER